MQSNGLIPPIQVTEAARNGRRADGRLRDTQVADRFGRRVFITRRRAGLSQEELGRRCGLHRTHISYIEHGQRLPRIDTLLKLALALEVRPEELLRTVV